MGLKKIIRKAAKLILESSPDKYVTVNVGQITNGEILKGKTVVITGGGSGIGFEIAKRCIAEGAKVIIAGRSENRLQKAIAELGGSAQYIQFDVSAVSNAMDFLMGCEKKLGKKIDFLVSNAGVSLHENEFSRVTEEGFDKQFNTNLKGNYFLCKAFLELKLKEKEPSGELLVITSESGDQAYDIPYGMTKASVNTFVKAMSQRVYQNGIRVNAIAPGVTETEMTSDYASPSNGNMYRKCASGRIFKPEEVAEVALFLLSDASMCINGEIIHCNAGNHIKTFWD